MQTISAVWLYPLILVAGPFAGLAITANILMSLIIDPYGLTIWRILGDEMMTGRISLIAMF
jgi:hypothetical protein